MKQAISVILCTLLTGVCSADDNDKIEPFSLVGLLRDDEALNRPHDVELQGNIAFVPGKGGSLAIIDVSDVTQPKLLSSLVGIEGLEDAETVLPMGDILLLGTRDFLAVDVSDPRKPVVKKRILDRPRIDKINGMALRGDRVFTTNKSEYVTVFDVSDPSDPVLKSVFDAKQHGGLRAPQDIAVFGDHIIVVSAENSGACSHRTPTLPFIAWRIPGRTSFCP